MKRWCLLLLLAACDDATPEDYRDLAESSRGCAATEECVLVGAGECTCDTPINRSAEEDLRETADNIDCQYVTISCPAHENLRCEAGRCITDASP